jgi:hypothetical protein
MAGAVPSVPSPSTDTPTNYAGQTGLVDVSGGAADSAVHLDGDGNTALK